MRITCLLSALVARQDKGIAQERTVISRRSVLRGTAIGGFWLAAAALTGCRSSSESAPGASEAPAASVAGNAGKTALDAIKAKYPATFQDPPGMQPRKGGTLTTFNANDIASFDTTKSGASGNLSHTNTVMDTLLRRKMTTNADELRGTGDPRGDLEGSLAQGLPEVTPDGLTVTFKLRPGVKWQNIAPVSGRSFTSQDVLKAYQRYATTGVFQEYFESVARMETPDPLTLKVTLKQPNLDFMIPLAEQNTGIFPMEIVDNNTIDRVIIGTGPMMVKEVRKGQDATYERNPNYWGPAPYLDGYRIKIMQDPAAQLAAYRAEQLVSTSAKQLKDVEAIRSTNPKSQLRYVRAPKSTFHTAFNMALPKWQDERVRRAVSLAIDRETLNATLYDGLGYTLPNIPWTYLFTEEPTTEATLGKYFRYDPAESKKRLQAAGQENLQFEYVYQNAYLGEGQNAMILDLYRKAGFKVTPVSLDYVSFNSMLASVKYPDTIQAWDSHGEVINNYFSNQIRSNSPGNWFTIKDTQLDTWAGQQSVELDSNKRKDILRKIWDRIQDQVYHVETTNPAGFTLYQPFVHGLQWGRILGESVGTPFGYSNGNFIGSIWTEKSI
ncbi:MAG: ABC transporter substrate-binding protein [Chloroflexi bacterium]|nr:MAG: ABC transporter substrate-binding protein [Chloroflexota bacterium]